MPNSEKACGFCSGKQELSARLSGKDAAILKTYMQQDHFAKVTDIQLETPINSFLRGAANR